MISTHRSWRTDVALRTVSDLHTQDVAPLLAATSLRGRRSVVTMAEPEDAQLTGMTRSLDRRLLALNLKPASAHVQSATAPVLKVA